MALDNPEQVEQVRFLIADLDDPPLLTSEQIDAALTAEGGSELLAAARCLETIAVSEVLVSKKIRTQDLTTDGAAVSAELRALADRYRARAREEDPVLGAWDGFDLAPVLPRRRPELTEPPFPETWGL